MTPPINIRPAQFEIFSRHVVETFRNRVAEQLQARYPERAPQQLLALVDVGITRCQDYGIGQRTAVHGYIELLAEHGSGLDQGPAAARMRAQLADRSMPDGARVSLLRARLAAIRD